MADVGEVRPLTIVWHPRDGQSGGRPARARTPKRRKRVGEDTRKQDTRRRRENDADGPGGQFDDFA